MPAKEPDRDESAEDRIYAAMLRYQRSMDELNRRSKESEGRFDALGEDLAARDARLMSRWERSENLFIEAITDITRENRLEARRMRQQLDDMRDEIRANTRAVLAMLDRLGPEPA